MEELVTRTAEKMGWRRTDRGYWLADGSAMWMAGTTGLTNNGIVAIEDRLLRAGWIHEFTPFGYYRWWERGTSYYDRDRCVDHEDRATAAMLALEKI